MSRYQDEYDGDDDLAVLAQGRWEHNSRTALKGKRGRASLTLLREALLALPEPRLIEGALCTVGGPERVPDVTEAEIDAKVAVLKAKGFWHEPHSSRERVAEDLRDDRDEQREAIADASGSRGQGCGVCAIGALLWYRLVRDGATPDDAFAALPSLVGEGLDDTAFLAEKDARVTFTLAWEMAYRNDETYSRMTPEGRYTAFLAWLDAELGTAATETITQEATA
jgi:hypothetical protein